jgi:hypothetical protein
MLRHDKIEEMENVEYQRCQWRGYQVVSAITITRFWCFCGSTFEFRMTLILQGCFIPEWEGEGDWKPFKEPEGVPGESKVRGRQGPYRQGLLKGGTREKMKRNNSLVSYNHQILRDSLFTSNPIS